MCTDKTSANYKGAFSPMRVLSSVATRVQGNLLGRLGRLSTKYCLSCLSRTVFKHVPSGRSTVQSAQKPTYRLKQSIGRVCSHWPTRLWHCKRRSSATTLFRTSSYLYRSYRNGQPEPRQRCLPTSQLSRRVHAIRRAQYARVTTSPIHYIH